MSIEKIDRNQKIIRCYLKHPDWSYGAIARMFHMKGKTGKPSRQIVRRIIARYLVKMGKMQ